MPACVETMFSVREVPWHGLGTIVEEAPTSSEALRLAGLDWAVNQELILRNNKEVPGYRMNVRDKDDSVLGIVSDRYKIVQNIDAFAFTDTLIGDEVHYETAGSLRNGKTVWLLAQMPKTELAGDETEQYLCFANTHDGSGAVRVCITPVRVVCQNTLNYALAGAKRAWSIRHTGDINMKIREAQETLKLAHSYMDDLKDYAEYATTVKVDDRALQKCLDSIFKPGEKATEREKQTMENKKEQYMICYAAPDIVKFRGTLWGALNAMSDFATHAVPARMTANYAENNWGRTMNGHPYMDAMMDYFK